MIYYLDILVFLLYTNLVNKKGTNMDSIFSYLITGLIIAAYVDLHVIPNNPRLRLLVTSVSDRIFVSVMLTLFWLPYVIISFLGGINGKR